MQKQWFVLHTLTGQENKAKKSIDARVAIERMEELPLCNRLIRETHAVLMNSVRGCDKTPGEFRVSQNWIGGVGRSFRV